MKILIEIQLPGGLSEKPPPVACDWFCPNVTKSKGRLPTRLTFAGGFVASSATFKSARRTVASDPANATDLPFPLLMSKRFDSLSSRDVDGPRSISNFAVLPFEV